MNIITFYLLPSFLISTINCYAIEGDIYCGTWIDGATSYGGDINYYKFHLLTQNNSIAFSVLFNTCGSNYDTWLYLIHNNGTLIRSCDDCGNCGTRTKMTVNNLYNQSYIIGIGGYSTRYGSYHLAINCSSPYGTPSPIYQTPGPITITPSPSIDIDDGLECNTKVRGATTFASDINYYSLYIESDTNKEYNAIFDSCGSEYDTHLYLYDAQFNVITHCDDCGECGVHSIIQSTIDTNQSYIVGIGGYSSHHGNYTVSLKCQEIGQYNYSLLPAIIGIVIICCVIAGCCYFLLRCLRRFRNRRQEIIVNNMNMQPAPNPVAMQRIVAVKPQHLYEGVISQPIPVSPFKGYQIPQQQGQVQALPPPQAFVNPYQIHLNAPPPAYSALGQIKSEGK